ncbi:MAG: S-adenosyl-l-methionine hydroxide adenosyltransferase family protein [Methanotrichaceae archaeon]
MRIITLLTDFGSFYPAQMKGVILSRLEDKGKEITFVDIAHDISPQDIRAGAFALLSSVRYFPEGTIHIAVVDPGVGTERLGIALESRGQFFVGPDNGLLVPAAKSLGTPRGYKIACKFDAAATFHGRDIFAPVAAMLADGISIQSLGPRVRPIDIGFGNARRTEDGILANIIYVDHFGNLILNMREIPSFGLCLKGIKLKRVRTYAEARRIEPLITIGSHGFAEIAVNQGSAADAFGLKAGDKILLEEIDCSE